MIAMSMSRDSVSDGGPNCASHTAPSLGWAPMRITAFRARLAEEFGALHADTIARDHVFSALGGRTVDQALDAGIPAKDVWRAVCDAFEVPTERR